MKGYQIVKIILEQFPGLPERLSELFGKKAVWYRSHGYELKKDNPLANGNLSAADHILRMTDEYEAAAPGAGQALAEILAGEFRARFKTAPAPCDDRAIRTNLNTEFYEAIRELDKKDLSDQTPLELAKTDKELSEIEKAIGEARAHVRREQRRKEMKTNFKLVK